MKVKLSPGLLGISGMVAAFSGTKKRLLFRTGRDGSTNAYLVSEDRYKRKTPLSEKEIENNRRFKAMAQEVARLKKNGDTRTRKQLWDAVKQQFTCFDQG